MKTKLRWVEGLFLLVPFLLLAALWQRIPARVPMHWNLDGQIDRWGPKGAGMLLLPLASIGIAATLRLVPRFDPRLRRDASPSDRMRSALQIVSLALVAFFFFIFLLVLAAALGFSVSFGRILVSILLALFVVLGNYLSVLRPNYFIGLRTPWTLENPETWRATHRLGGRLMVFGSLALLLLQFAVSERVFGFVAIGATLLFTGWSIFYSWHYFHTRDVADRLS
ncbi:MAG: SdpI family protein [Verrucomicrobiota bacterium]|nr:SdpI family protein [Verrucomicrobiota bacterium]